MANFNRQGDNAKNKLRRRRRELARIVAKWKADPAIASSPDLPRRIRDLRKQMRCGG
jgi:hypothetical protein